MIEYTWTSAGGDDVADIIEITKQDHFYQELTDIFVPDPVAYTRNITFAIVNQFFLPTTELVSIARDNSGKMLAYTWAKNGDRAAWSDEVMISIRMSHLALGLSSRLKIHLVNDMLGIWERWARYLGTSIICSNTMRKEQSAFLRLHERHGYVMRGGSAYKKLDLTQATPANSLNPS